MIHIKYPDGKEPEVGWLLRAAALTESLKTAANKEARHEIIDSNSNLWGEIKAWLMAFSDDKCWFSEARDTYSHWHVEHFRPKKEAKNPNREGYWWLAFDYLNYRLCGGVGNSKKGSYFPLRRGTPFARCPDDNCDDESPTLIDPTREDDVTLLTFAEGGRALPTHASGWAHERAMVSIERYKLNDHAPLSRGRENVWQQCKIKAGEMERLILEQEKAESPTRRAQIKRLAEELKEMTKETAMFSAVANAFLDQDSRNWLKRCRAGR